MEIAPILKSSEWAEFTKLLRENIESGQTFVHFEKQVRMLVKQTGWAEVFPVHDKREFALRADVLRASEMRRVYMDMRLRQLQDGNFSFWVYRSSGSHNPTPEHEAWDGLVLSVDHPFWQSHFPPNDWGCGCRVFGARSLAGAIRRGGDSEKELPANWSQPVAETGVPAGLHPLFVGQSGPRPEEVLPYVLSGAARSKRWSRS